ncbi:Clavaminate synthase-like protein [Aspergillus japonicus CBS 114.51]|uniref:Clavaminate synthase-like protein n=1 Tax=Aspergillus japonicus CBS 114.51 TaxID=1448312 RepID=A0A8T8WJA7_ASPJA|nr:Clavaminate synthase-like protein [Aspergillus japonicus CBS 114.51]RAH75891.1 Clavaminate synthase-like protein [Aspergillus japonicus CBS 114.51]
MSFGLPTGQLFKSNNLHSWWDLHRLTEIEAFKAQCNDLTFKVLSCFAWHMGLPKDFFTTSHQDGLPRNTLKFIKYPKLAIKPDDAVPRLTEHTDWGSITLLFTDSPGLEVLDPQDQWHEVPQLPGGIVINIGDALSLWTGQQLKSTMHRISWEKVPVDQDRYSMPYFVHPNFSKCRATPLGQRLILSCVLLCEKCFMLTAGTGSHQPQISQGAREYGGKGDHIQRLL